MNEEEEFELMYEEEMQMLHDEDLMTNPVTIKNTPIQLQSTQHSLRNVNSSLSSPQLSQISQSSNVINRRLFDDTPHQEKRTSSTPFPRNDPLAEIQNIGLVNNNRKRRLEDLFGDINDIEELHDFDYGNMAKKTRSEEEIDLEMIEKILEARQKYREQINPLRSTEVDRLQALHHFKMQNLSYSVPKWPFISLVRSDTERVYVRMHSEEYETDRINEVDLKTKGFSGLLGDAKQQIWDSARELVLKRLTATTQEVECEMIENFEEQDLWVEKYKPKKYVDLLSDEATNRSLLQWLKMWDKVVFGKEIVKKEEKPGTLNTFNKRTGRFEMNGGWKTRSKAGLNTDRDEHGRPIQKIALLCGPPGLGKTTLAHTIAKHAGYVIREMNASDDRSPDAFRLTLENGTQMKSVLNEENKPNCIILDEIDGAPNNSIDFLIKFINGTVTQKSTKPGTKEKKPFILKRPIICICNDMYVPALRQLRQIAFVVSFPQMASPRLAERLQTIAYREGIKTDLTALLALADKTGNDVRSCISMLQFFRGMKKPLTLFDVLKSNIGQKDRHKGLFGVWAAIFQIQRPKRTVLELEINDPDQTQVVSVTDMSSASRMKNILEVVHMGGDYERLMQGVFENYLTQKMPDPNMTGVAEATEWFCFSDRIQRFINQNQNYSVYSYLQYGFVMWHFLFAGMAWPKINFPNKGFEALQKTTTRKMILAALKKGFTAACVGVGEGSTVLLDAVPLIKRVICPGLRSVSLQLLTNREKTDLKHTVDVMSDLGLTYTQIKAADNTYQYQLEPDLSLLSQFTGINSPQLNYWGKQLIAREVEMEQMRRVSPKYTSNNNNKLNTTAMMFSKAGDRKAINSVGGSKKPLPNHLQMLIPKAIQNKPAKETICKDFFGRIVSKAIIPTSQEDANDVIVKSPIWYRYKEGFNNAVRKDITISDLL